MENEDQVINRESGESAPRKKRKSSTSPTERTIKECTRRGWIAGVVERHIPFPRPMGTKIDLFGVIDLVVIVPPRFDAVLIYGQQRRCLEPGYILAIQATGGSGGAHAARRTKILAESRAKAWVEAGGRFELWSWSKRVAHNKDGSKSARPAWTLRVETYAEMIAGAQSTELPADLMPDAIAVHQQRKPRC